MANNNSGSNMGRAVATIAVWAGVGGLSYLFHSFGILSGGGATWLVIGAFLITAGLWKS